MDNGEEKLYEDMDGNNEGFTDTSGVNSRINSEAPQVVSADDHYYNMRHEKRGYAFIFKQETFDSPLIKERRFASQDALKCKEAFEALRFDVEEYNDLGKVDFLDTLNNIRQKQMDNCDCMAIIFMSHGCEEHDKEYIWLRDGKVATSTLWRGFTADKCKQLAGKPKFYFIQACRGDTTEKGITLKKGLKWKTDGRGISKPEEDYTIPLQADMLMMWASYPGMVAFRGMSGEIRGSIFLHYLCQVLLSYHEKENEDLSSMLLRVTRHVAVKFKSSDHECHYLTDVKQTPTTVSTLMRKVLFGSQGTQTE